MIETMAYDDEEIELMEVDLTYIEIMPAHTVVGSAAWVRRQEFVAKSMEPRTRADSWFCPECGFRNQSCAVVCAMDYGVRPPTALELGAIDPGMPIPKEAVSPRRWSVSGDPYDSSDPDND